MNDRPRQFLPGLLKADTKQKSIDSRAVSNAQPGNGPLAGLTNNYSLNLVNFDWVTWHDYEWNNWVTVDALIFAAIGFLNLKGIWRANTAYGAGESVFDPTDVTQIYLCNTPHTSGTNFNTDKPLYWDLRTDVTAPVSSVFGRIGDVVGVSTDYVAFYPMRSEVYTKSQSDAQISAINQVNQGQDTAIANNNAAITVNANAITALNTNIPLTYMPFSGGQFTGGVNVASGAANQFEVRRDAASRIRFMSGDGSKNGMWQEYTQSSGSGRFRFYAADGSTFFNMDMTADGDVRMNGTRWSNTVTPDLTSLLTKGRADALYDAVTPAGQGVIRFIQDHSTLGIASFNDLAVDNDPNWANQQYMIRISASTIPTDGFPNVGTGDFIQSHNWGGTTAFQMGFNAAGADADTIMYIRRKSSGVWSRWYVLEPIDTLLLTGSNDLNTIDIGGNGKKQTYRISGVPTNGFPNIGSGDWLEFYQYSGTAGVQRGIDYQTGTVYTRSKISGVWSAWAESGGGGGAGITSGDTFPLTPLDDALHYKTSAPVGLYVYFNDGDSTQWVQTAGSDVQEFHDPTNVASWRISGKTLECWGQSVKSNGDTITFPKAFAEVPAFNINDQTGGTGIANPISRSTTEVTITIFVSSTGAALTNRQVSWHAIGQWDGVS